MESEAALSEDYDDNDDPSNFLIRANQGHSIAIASEGLLEPISEANMPATVVHGTTPQAWKLILKSGGLSPMGRNHVHFASGLPAGFAAFEGDEEKDGNDELKGEKKPVVISGMRNSSNVLIYIDLPRALSQGVRFWRSDNGVILSEGDPDGLIKVDFFKRVEDRRSGKTLVRDGKEVGNVSS